MDLIQDIQNNTRVPDSVILVDNTADPSRNPKITAPNIKTLYFGGNIGVNAVWNYGIRNCMNSHLSVLNDDIRIPPHFFEATEQVFKKSKNIGIVCPHTVHSPDDYDIPNWDGKNDLKQMRRREGWAFTIRNELRKQLPLIPKELFVFMGDNWLWCWTYELNFVWRKDFSTTIYHRIGGALRENRELRALLRDEKRICVQMLNASIADYRKIKKKRER